MSIRNVTQRDRELGAVLRRIVERISALERRPDGRPNASHDLPVKFGSYTLSEDDDGNLVATNDDTGTETILASP